MVCSTYYNHLVDQIQHFKNDASFMKSLENLKPEFTLIAGLDFEPALPILNTLYCPIKYSEHRDSECMLRSLLLMTMLKEHSITEWVKQTRVFSVYAVIAGFEPSDTPGIGTYYDFINRFIDGPYKKPSQVHVLPSEFNAGRHLRSVKEEKQAKEEAKQELKTQYNSQSEKLAAHLLEETGKARPEGFEKLMEDLFITLGLHPTINDGLITDLGKLVVSGDGSIIKTAASPYGKSACDCRKNGILNCDHPKFFRSPTAEWCYDAAHSAWKYGDKYYHIIVTQNGHDFPLIVIMPGGNESDYTLSLKAIDRLLKINSEHHLTASINIFAGDGHHDCKAHYNYLDNKGIKPVIPLSQNSENSKAIFPHIKENPNVRFDLNGNPLCPGGKPMRRHAYDKRKGIHVFTCPAKCPTRKKGKYNYVYDKGKCPKGQCCCPESSIGPCIYVRPSSDPRYFPPIPRDSNKFKEIMKQRSASERVNAVIDSYHIDRSSRNANRGLVRLTFINIIIHAGIRYNETLKKSSEQQLFDNTIKIIFRTEELVKRYRKKAATPAP